MPSTDRMPDSTISAEREYQAGLERGEKQERRYGKRARERIIEKLWSLDHLPSGTSTKGLPSAWYVAEWMLDDSTTYGFDADAIDTDDLAGAIVAADENGNASLYQDLDDDVFDATRIEDIAHRLVFKQARKAVKAIMDTSQAAMWVEDELLGLAEDDT